MVPIVALTLDVFWRSLIEAAVTALVVTFAGGFLATMAADRVAQRRAANELRARLVRELALVMNSLNIATATFWALRKEEAEGEAAARSAATASKERVEVRTLDEGRLLVGKEDFEGPDRTDLDSVHANSRATLLALQLEIESYGLPAIAQLVHTATDCLTVRYFLATGRAPLRRRMRYSSVSTERVDVPHAGLFPSEMAGEEGWDALGDKFVEVSRAAVNDLATAELSSVESWWVTVRSWFTKRAEPAHLKKPG